MTLWHLIGCVVDKEAGLFQDIDVHMVLEESKTHSIANVGAIACKYLVKTLFFLLF